MKKMNIVSVIYRCDAKNFIEVLVDFLDNVKHFKLIGVPCRGDGAYAKENNKNHPTPHCHFNHVSLIAKFTNNCLVLSTQQTIIMP